ncbi:hypothetical protein ACFLXU_05635 [Chloroflexota bacterium]
MKYGNAFRTLTLAIVLAMLVIAIPVTPAQAQTLSVTPIAGSVGTVLTINGGGFASGDNYEITFAHGTSFAQLIDSGQVTGSTISVSFSVQAVPRGNYIIHASYVHSGIPGTSSPSFTVTPQVELNTSSGYVGDEITVSGNGFSADSNVTIYFDATSVGTVYTDERGTFSDNTFTIPQSCEGDHTVTASDNTGYSPDVSFTTLPGIVVAPASGTTGDQVIVIGTGFSDNSEIIFYLDDEIIDASATITDAKGNFINDALTIPLTSHGTHTIKAEDTSNNSATAAFSTTGQAITITPPSGASGTTVTVNGGGFSANTAVAILYNNRAVTTNPAAVNTDDKGTFTASFSVPVSGAGAYWVEITDGTNRTGTIFMAKADAVISQETSTAKPGHIGMEVTITGSGFRPNVKVTITYTSDPVVLATVTADKNGAFGVIITIPPSIGGNHILAVTDGNTTKQFIFAVESEPPPIPAPLRPETETKAKAETFLDWGNVSDPSSVTYTLQIASDAAFTTIVLEKEELTASEYTLSKEEKLPAVRKKAPYHWRVRAIDGAHNEGEWSVPRSFYVGFLFIIHDWAMYTLLVLGAGFFTYLGFLWGRRSTYS